MSADISKLTRYFLEKSFDINTSSSSIKLPLVSAGEKIKDLCVEIHRNEVGGIAISCFTAYGNTYIAVDAKEKKLDTRSMEEDEELLCKTLVDHGQVSELFNKDKSVSSKITLHALYKLETKVTITPKEQENLLYAATDPDGDVDFLDFIVLFGTVSIFKIDRPRHETGALGHGQLISYIATFAKRDGAISSSLVVEKIRELIIKNYKYLPYENLSACMEQRKASYAFLEVYKCIELIFPFYRILQLIKKIDDNSLIANPDFLCPMQITTIAKDMLGWRRGELDSLVKWFKLIGEKDPAILDLLEIPTGKLGAKKNTGKEISEEKINTLADRYYQFRNKIAHQTWERNKTTESEYECLIFFSLQAIDSIYAYITNATRHNQHGRLG